MKKNSVIRQLLYDGPFSLEAVGINDEQRHLLGVLSDLEENLIEKLRSDKTAMDLFKKFQDASDDLYSEEMCYMFEHWFKLGVLLGMELAQE